MQVPKDNKHKHRKQNMKEPITKQGAVLAHGTSNDPMYSKRGGGQRNDVWRERACAADLGVQGTGGGKSNGNSTMKRNNLPQPSA